MNILLHGDCLEKMKEIPDKSVDMILCDPPYGTTACAWDTIVPFEPMWNELKRITKDDGAICLFGGEPFSSRLRLSNLKMFKYDWIWNKNSSSGFLNAKLKPMNTIEIVSVFSQGKTANKNLNNMKYYPQELKKYGKITKSGNQLSNDEHGIIRKNQPSFTDGYLQEFSNYPKNYLEFPYVKQAVHPTQKPTQLLEYLIRTYTRQNETVLDFTMGSGSTGVACVNIHRNFIGIEKDDKYFKIAQKRIDEAVLEYCDFVSNFAPIDESLDIKLW